MANPKADHTISGFRPYLSDRADKKAMPPNVSILSTASTFPLNAMDFGLGSNFLPSSDGPSTISRTIYGMLTALNPSDKKYNQLCKTAQYMDGGETEADVESEGAVTDAVFASAFSVATGCGAIGIFFLAPPPPLVVVAYCWMEDILFLVGVVFELPPLIRAFVIDRLFCSLFFLFLLLLEERIAAVADAYVSPLTVLDEEEGEGDVAAFAAATKKKSTSTSTRMMNRMFGISLRRHRRHGRRQLEDVNVKVGADCDCRQTMLLLYYIVLYFFKDE